MTTPPAEAAYTPNPEAIRLLDAGAAEYERYLLATIRQAKAEALREAAAEVYPRAATWLRARASRIEAGE